MDVNKLVEVLCATLNPSHREEAEQQLNEVREIVGFAPVLLQVVMSEQMDMPVRQAGVIYLKNMVNQFWEDREATTPGEAVPFNIEEQDKQAIRENIVEAIIAAPEPVRVQLGVCISVLIKHDYPGRWPSIAEKLATYIQSENTDTWLGALICLHQLVKNYEYKNSDERDPLNATMQVMLPMIHQRCLQLLPDQSELSVLIQKQILKTFFALIQFHLPMELVTKDIFTQWMELVRQIVDRPVPEETNQVDIDDRPELIWWKCKKWALHILSKSFERYGSPGKVMKEYNQFSEWYLKNFTGGIMQVLFRLLDQYRQKMYVSPRVLQLTLSYLNEGVSHALCWKFMKPHMMTVIQEILFPLMCHTDEDEELWETDPIEYIRIKYDVFEEFFSPVMAAQVLLHASVSKRKEVLQKSMGFIRQLLTTPNLDPRQKAGALYMIGALADVLLTKKIYKDQVELMLCQHVFPEFQSPHGYLRARACWVLQYFCEINFKKQANLALALGHLRNCLVTDKEVPVRVEAAIAMQMILSDQDKAKGIMQPHVREIIMELLNVIRETENDDLNGVMQKLVCIYVEEVMPLAMEMCTHLAQTFAQMLDSNEGGSDDKAVAAMGILNTLETILTVMEDQKEILAHIEGIVLNVIGVILQHNVVEFYEELLSLVYSLTCQQVSEPMWSVFPTIYDMFQNDGADNFTDMMPALHNYITVSPEKFLANPKNMEIVYNMCKTVLTRDAGEEAECHAAKLLEVILLQYRGQVDQVITSFVELALERLTREVQTSELRTMCLQVVVAALYYNPAVLLDILEKTHLPNSTESVTSQFLKQWFHDTNCFLGLHDRKVCVLGICTLIDTPSTRPGAVSSIASEILPALLMLFSGLKRAYASQAAENEEDGEDDDDEEEYEEEELESDEDEIDEEGQKYLEKLERSANGEDFDSDEDDDLEETDLESYQTPLDKEECTVDEYQIFKHVLSASQQTDPSWYQALVGHLNKEQREQLQEVFTLADQRKAAQESKKIEQGGGYVFQNKSVPSTFNFTSP